MLSSDISQLSVEDHQTQQIQNCIDRGAKKRDSSCSPCEEQEAVRNEMAAGGSSNLDVVKVTWSQLTELVGKVLNQGDSVARDGGSVGVEDNTKDQSAVGEEKERCKDLSETETQKEVISVDGRNENELE